MKPSKRRRRAKITKKLVNIKRAIRRYNESPKRDKEIWSKV